MRKIKNSYLNLHDYGTFEKGRHMYKGGYGRIDINNELVIEEIWGELTPHQQEITITYIKFINELSILHFKIWRTSYELKHDLQSDFGEAYVEVVKIFNYLGIDFTPFYMTNNVFKIGMLKAGVKIKDTTELNWKISPKRKIRSL